MAKNRYPLVVPCHRVLAAAANRRLLGTAGAMKRRPLSLEALIELNLA
jgi:O6-methylguanine-DNA--protein-cysteine methyltransferase